MPTATPTSSLLGGRLETLKAQYAALIAIFVGWHGGLLRAQDRLKELGDGAVYLAMAKALARHEPIVAPQPFDRRIGLPWLAQAFARDLSDQALSVAFLRIDVAFNAASMFLLLYLLSRRCRPWQAFALTMVFVTAYLGPFRFSYWYPQLTDAATHFLVVAWVALIEQERFRGVRLAIALSVLAAVSALVRETGLLAPACWVLALRLEDLRADLARSRARALGRLALHLAPIAAAVAARGVIAHGFNADGARFFDTLLEFFYKKTFPRCVHALFIVLGALAPLFVAFWKDVSSFFRSERHYGAFVVLTLVLGWAGGHDTERLIFLGFPPILLCAAAVVGRQAWLAGRASYVITAVLAVYTFFSQRVLWILPEIHGGLPKHIWLSPQGTDFDFYNLKSFTAPQATSFTSLWQHTAATALVVLLIVVLRRRAERSGPPSPDAAFASGSK